VIFYVKKRAKAKKALTRLRTIANKLIRELQRKLSTHSLFETYQKLLGLVCHARRHSF
jgi:IS5 family transposase